MYGYGYGCNRIEYVGPDVLLEVGEDDVEGEGDSDGVGEGESIILPLLLIPPWAIAIAYRLHIAFHRCPYAET